MLELLNIKCLNDATKQAKFLVKQKNKALGEILKIIKHTNDTYNPNYAKKLISPTITISTKITITHYIL